MKAVVGAFNQEKALVRAISVITNLRMDFFQAVLRSGETSSDMEDWLKDYLQGTGCEMYTEVLSPSFVGMTFNQASVLCFSKLNLLMLAIECRSDVGQYL